MYFRTELYKIFTIVAKCKSISKAAEELYMTQSAVSQSIKQLENTLGITLFFRTAKGVDLTDAGNILYRYTASAMELLDTGLTKMEALKTLDDGELKIGASDTITSNFLSPRLEQFHKIYPNIKIQIINRVSLDAVNLLKNGKIDIAFCNFPIQDETLEMVECMKVHDTFVAGNEYKELKDKIFTREELSKLPLIMLESASNSRKFVDNAFLESGLILTPSFEIGAHEVLLQLAQINLGVSCVIKEFSTSYLDNHSLFELKQENSIPERAMGYCYSKNLPFSPAMKKFIKFLDMNS